MSEVQFIAGDCATCGKPVPGGGHTEDCTGLRPGSERVIGSAVTGIVTEYGIEMSGGGFHVRNPDPEIEAIFPLAQWIPVHRRHGGHVWRRRVTVAEDWVEVGDDGEPL